MQNINQRPVCHRAEDLVTYLYGEATAEEARDFSAHLQHCDACRAEFGVFNQVHHSIVAWRNEALGAAAPERQHAELAKAVVAAGAEPHGRKLSGLAALREFFTVSPLWLRGATALAGLVLCALVVFAISRTWQQPTMIADNNKKYTEDQFRRAVREEVAKLVDQRIEGQTPTAVGRQDVPKPSRDTIVRRARPKNQPPNKLTREEREQLAADLGLIPALEEERPFVLPEEPNE